MGERAVKEELLAHKKNSKWKIIKVVEDIGQKVTSIAYDSSWLSVISEIFL